MRTYRLGNEELDARLQQLVADAVAASGDHADHTHDEDIIAELLVSGLKMMRVDAEYHEDLDVDKAKRILDALD